MRKVWEWIKSHLGIVAGIIGIIAAFFVGRRSANGSAVQAVGDGLDRSKEAAARAEEQNRELGKRLDDCQKDAGELKQENRELGERLEQCQSTAAGIREDNKGIEERLDDGIKILQEAKERAEEGED